MHLVLMVGLERLSTDVGSYFEMRALESDVRAIHSR